MSYEIGILGSKRIESVTIANTINESPKRGEFMNTAQLTPDESPKREEAFHYWFNTFPLNMFETRKISDEPWMNYFTFKDMAPKRGEGINPFPIGEFPSPKEAYTGVTEDKTEAPKRTETPTFLNS